MNKPQYFGTGVAVVTPFTADLKVDFVLMAGEEERSNDLWTVRQMETGNQQQLSIAAAVECVLDQCG